MVAALDGTPLIIVILLVVVVFGGSQLPKLARNLGTAGREFRKAHEEAEADAERDRLAKEAQAGGPVTPAPLAPVNDDRVTLSRSELEALLDEREARAKRDAN